MLCYFSKPNVKSFLILLISEFSIKAWKGKHWRTKTKLSRKGKWTKTEKKCCSIVVQLHQISHEDLVTSRYHPDRFVAPTIHRWKENEHSHGRAHLKPLSQRKLQACPDFGHFLRDLNLTLMCGGEHSVGWYSYLHPQFTFLRNHIKDRGTAESLLNVLKKTLIEDSITIMMMGIDDNEQNTCRLAHLPGSSQALGHLKLRSCFLSWEWLRNSCVANQETWFTHHLSCTRSPEEINE